ncbi:hypothetical protein HK103_006213, partial [Boothiomyces macroporosus]
KRKCDRARPSCYTCTQSGISCSYPESSNLDQSEREIEERLAKLEQFLKKKETKSFSMNSYTGQDVPSSQSNETLVDQIDNDLLALGLKSLDVSLFFVTEDYLVHLAEVSMPIRYLIYALAGVIAPPEVLSGFRDSQDMSVFYLERAKSYVSAILPPHPRNVVAWIMLCICCIRFKKDNEGYKYLAIAYEMAKELGMNNEAQLKVLAKDPTELFNYRATWWMIHLSDNYFTERGLSVMKDQDHAVFLPMDHKLTTASEHETALAAVSVMQSSDWFTPPFKNQSIDFYRVLLHRIFTKTLEYKKRYYDQDQVMSNKYIQGTLLNSLNMWFNSLPESITHHINLARTNSQSENPAFTYKVMNVVIKFNFIKINLLSNSLLQLLIQDFINVGKTTEYKESIAASLYTADMLQHFITKEDTFTFLSVQTFLIFHIALPLILASKIPQLPEQNTRIVSALNVHYLILRKLYDLKVCSAALVTTFEYLLQIAEPSLVALEYANFKACSGVLPNVNPQKRKCNRSRPSCSNCINSNITCEYPEKSDLPPEIEERLLTLEKYLIQCTVPLITHDGPVVPPTNFEPKQQDSFIYFSPVFDLSSQANQELFETDRKDLIEYAIQCCSFPRIYLSEQFLLNCISYTPPLKYAFCSIGATLAPPSVVHPEIKDNTQLALLYLEKSLSYVPKMLAAPSYSYVLTLIAVFRATMRVNRSNEGFKYFTLAIQMAKQLGLNVEYQISYFSNVDQEREDLKSIWWLLAHYDSYFVERKMNMIAEDDHQLFLPMTDTSLFEDFEDEIANFGMVVMKSNEWFSPGIPNQCLAAYRILLDRIFFKVGKYLHLFECEDGLLNPQIVRGSILGSLREWKRSLPENIVLVGQLDFKNADTPDTWLTLQTFLKFHTLHIMLFSPQLLKAFVENASDLTTTEEFIISIESAHENARVLNHFLSHKASFKFITHLDILSIFQSALPLVCAYKLVLTQKQLEQIAQSLDIHIQVLREHVNHAPDSEILWRKMDSFIHMNDPGLISLEYALFKSKNFRQ